MTSSPHLRPVPREPGPHEPAPPPALHARASDDLRFIRATMERAAAYTAVPGWGGVLMGLTALLAAPVAHAALVNSADGSTTRWLLTWLGAALLAGLVGATDMAHKARERSASLVRGPASRFALGLLPPLAAGAMLTLALYRAGRTEFLPGIWLLTYGAGVVCGGAVSIRAVRWMGTAFMALGAAALLTPARFGDAWMAAGFGGVHVLFGIWIARHHDG